MILYVICAFLAGVLCGMVYMYLRYCKMMRANIRELHELKLSNARIKGQLEVMRIMQGMEGIE